MTVLVFCFVIGMHGATCVYYLWRFMHQRRPISLVLAILPFGWPMALLREWHMLPLWAASWLVVLALGVGILHLIAVASIEAQRRR